MVPSGMTAFCVWITSCLKGWRAHSASSTSMHLPEAVDPADRPANHIEIPGHGADHLFLDDMVGRRHGKVQRRYAGNRPKRIVRSDADADGIGLGRDLLGLQQPAAMADVRLDDADRARRQQRIEL
jgi:hypothetical protein